MVINSSKNSEIFEILRQLRNNIAQKEEKKPFMIFHNKTLELIAEFQPKNFDELLTIKGIGQRKAEKYGPIILETIREFISMPLDLDDNKNRDSGRIFTVSEFINSLNTILTVQKAVVQGEVGKVDNRNGYSFFTLQDKNKEAILNCFVWNDRLNNLGIKFKEGIEVKARGYPEIYKRTGKFSFQVEYLGLVGEGILKQAFETLKKKLVQLGFFDSSRKKSLPRFCQKIGLITSQFADAKTDFLKHLGNYGFQIYFYDVRVEGLTSIDEIIEAIRWFNENMLDVDVLVLTRGGGSWESLQSFNSEAVAKAIFGSKIPIICGVGHEADETIADWVADVRASTPTHAAKILSDSWNLAYSQIIEFERNIFSTISKTYSNVKKWINSFNEFLNLKIKKFLESNTKKINYLATNLNLSFQMFFKDFNRIENLFFNNFQIFQSVLEKNQSLTQRLLKGLDQNSIYWFKIIRDFLQEKENRLSLVNPELRLKQGYSITLDSSGRIIKTSSQLKVDDSLETKIYQGSFSSRVEKIFKK